MEDFDATVPPKRAREPGNNNENYTPGDFDPNRTIPNRRMRREMGEFSVGDVIAYRYQVVSILGRGAMGVVYRCFDKVASIEVALKGLPPELAGNDWEMKEIRRNFQLVHNLHHHNIASYNTLEFDLNSGGYFLVMEFVDGVELRTYMENNRPDHATIINIITAIASALDYAHNQQILHRDIKPENIMIDRNGIVKILDFGLAAQIHSSMSRMSMVQDSSGTAPYMSPEQWRGRRQNASCDQYALGVVAYEMFAGFLPFESTDFNVLRSAVLNETPEELENVSPAIQNAVAKALSKTPGERFESCTAFAQALNGTDALRRAEKKGKEEERRAREAEEKRKEEERRKKEAEERERKERLNRQLEAGQKAYDAKNWQQAAKAFEEVLKIDHSNATAKKLLPDAQYNIGENYYNSLNYSNAVKWFRKAAEQGHVFAQNNLGFCYRQGYGVDKDYDLAVKWYRKAAEQGDAEAQHNLGNCYYNGRGVDKDYDLAVKWYRKAAKQGLADAQNNLGTCYYNGWGVDKDYDLAVKWYRKAAKQGLADAQNNLGRCYRLGYGVDKDYDLAVQWYRKAAEQGNAPAQCNLGFCYEKGYGVDKDYYKAVKWYRKAARNGNKTAQNNLKNLGESY